MEYATWKDKHAGLIEFPMSIFMARGFLPAYRSIIFAEFMPV